MKTTVRQHLRGFSLIELLVSIAMGLAILLVVLTMFQNMTSNSKLGQVQQRMSEDAQAAFQLIGQEMRQAGFNPIQTRTTTPERNDLSGKSATEFAMPIFGCSTGFANGKGTGAAAHIGQLTCNASGGTESFAVQYEADSYSPNVVTVANTPADCRGAAVVAKSQQLRNAANTVVGTAAYWVVENRYFIDGSGLNCVGNGGTPTFAGFAQPLVRNIEKMELKYGLAQPTNSAVTKGTDSKSISGYLLANQIGAASGTIDAGTVDVSFSTAAPAIVPSQRWSKLVKTVRLCLVVKGDSPVLDQDFTPAAANRTYGYYYGCSPEGATDAIAITDRYPRRSFFMHYALRNNTHLNY